nr:cytochrome P450 2D15-like [Cherax quadricarinatus]
MILGATRNYLLSDGKEGDLGLLGGTGPHWVELRRFLLRHLRDFGIGKTSCEPMIRAEVEELLEHIKNQNGQPIVMEHLFHRSVLNVLWGMVTGSRFKYGDKKLAKTLESFVKLADINLVSIIFFIPGVVKAMMYLPMLDRFVKPIGNICKFIREEIENYRSKKDWENIHSLLTLYLTEMKKYNGDHPIFNEHQLRAVMFEMFAAGMATTASTLTMGMYLVAKHPDVQQRVHQELDEVIGRERLPCYADLESLPYTRATIHEVQRVLNLIAFVVHCALEDCNFEGYDIPKGNFLSYGKYSQVVEGTASTGKYSQVVEGTASASKYSTGSVEGTASDRKYSHVCVEGRYALANMEDAMTDPKLWKNPDEFDPNNFLDDNGKYVKNGAFVPFGIGKRQCVGEALARMEVFVFLSSLFQKFTFTLVGEEVPPGNLYTFNAPVEFNAVAHVRPHL